GTDEPEHGSLGAGGAGRRRLPGACRLRRPAPGRAGGVSRPSTRHPAGLAGRAGGSRRPDLDQSTNLLRAGGRAVRPCPRRGNPRVGQRRRPALPDRPAGGAASDPDGQCQLLRADDALPRYRVTTFGNVLAFSPELWLLAGALVVFLVPRFVPGTAASVAL